VVDSGQRAYDGPYEAEFQQRFAEFQTAKHGVLVSNGTVALQLALEALDIGYGDEVILPVNTWQATALAVVDVNAVPILVDVEPDTYSIDPIKAEAAITPRTRAIIAVHLYDVMADMDRIRALAKKHNLAVIEDCAHAHGSLWQDQGAGSLGSLGCFSHQSSKSLNAGEGGFVTTNDDALYERLYSLRNCGRPRPGSDEAIWQPMQGGNYRVTEWQAAVLLAQLERLPEQVEKRWANLQFLDRQLPEVDGIAPLLRPSQVTRQGMYSYVVRYKAEAFDDVPIAAFREALSAELGTRVGALYDPLNHSPLYLPHTKRRYHVGDAYWRAIDPAQFDTPVAEHAFANEAMVFSHPHLLADQEAMQSIVEACAKLQTHRDELRTWAATLGPAPEQHKLWPNARSGQAY
jgi:L-glutamine:2-deoxy-scyllo-inosose/3-amino-2,3-dideoxy-scyllo-inosose aminotransferase